MNASDAIIPGYGSTDNRPTADRTEPAEWGAIYLRVNSRARQLRPDLLNGVAAVATIAGVIGTAGLLALLITGFHPMVSPFVLALFVIPPGLLAGAAVGHVGGGLFLRSWFGLDAASRRGFASRLAPTQVPAAWPEQVRRWLFTGDWLGTPSRDSRLSCLRLFVAGVPPLTCQEEDALWSETHRLLVGDGTWEVGANHHDITYARQLPPWVDELRRGDKFSDLHKRIGGPKARAWADRLWRDAGEKWPEFASGEEGASGTDGSIELHPLILAGGRPALAVMLRPSGTATEMACDEVNSRAA